MSPAEEYARRLKKREVRRAHYERLHIQVGNAKVALAAVIAVMAWATFARHLFSAWWLAAPVGLFFVLAVYHDAVLRKRACAERAADFYRKGIARMEDRWAGTGQTGERFNDLHHVYAADLDLFGKGSLFELLSLARTQMGEETLAGWLLAPASVEDLDKRHNAISDLRDRLDLREDLAVVGDDDRVGVHPSGLIKWAEAPNEMKPGWIRALAASLTVLFVLAFVVWGIWGFLSPILFVLLAEWLVVLRFRKHLEAVLHETENVFGDLDLLSSLLERFERESFESPRLQEIQRQISSHSIQASQAIARFRTIVQLIESRGNLFLRVLDIPLEYSIQVAFLAESWRREHGAAVRSWVTAVGELEALASLAAYGYEHPLNPFPEFSEGPGCLEVEGLGHPLLPAASCVPNDVKICDGVRVLLVSGSNMSGKSTLLRAVGINTVLAMAGAPVRADRMRLTPLQVGASIRINDSLQEGSSRFYAEITRLRRIFDLAGSNPPLLFLLDELLQGTNSSDRRTGAEGVIRSLLNRGAIGLVSTHDLALTEIEHSLNGSSRNAHFQDLIEDGRLRFDYKLREGIVTKSNGLELMRSIGLDV